jgi:hypothetical protein
MAIRMPKKLSEYSIGISHFRGKPGLNLAQKKIPQTFGGVCG